MNDVVGIIRRSKEMERELEHIGRFKERVGRVSVEGHRQFNPGWHMALDLRNMVLVSECITRAALERKESRGGHPRDDYPMTDSQWGRINVVLTADGDEIALKHQPVPEMPDELKQLFEESH